MKTVTIAEHEKFLDERARNEKEGESNFELIRRYNCNRCEN